MFERLWKASQVELAPTEEELKAKVQEGLTRSPEEKAADRVAHLDALQHQPSIKLTREEAKAHEWTQRLKGLQNEA